MQELVVLVNDENIPIGTADKRSVHTTDTPLHRAFSLFLFNSKYEVLLTKRAKTKKTFPGVWTNTVCGHVAPDETSADAVARRLREELGITGVLVAEVSPYRYRFADASGIVENEICPIFTGYFDGNPVPVPDEVDEWKWVPWEEFLNDTRSRPDPYSPWCREEAEIIDRILRRKDPETR